MPKFVPLLLALLLAQAAVPPVPRLFASAAATENAPSGPDGAAPDEADPALDGVPFADVARGFLKHCVRVFIHGKSHEGNEPTVGEFGEDIRNERATPVGGYWWDETHVVIHDPVLQDAFIRDIKAAPPGSDVLYPARVAGRFSRVDAMLLEILPDADGNLPEAHPIDFSDGDINEAVTLVYGWKSGEWRITLEGGLGASSLSDDGEETAELGAQGVFITPEGVPIGLSFGDEITLSGDFPARLGRETADLGYLPEEDAAKGRERLRAQLSRAVLETVVRIRINVDDDEDADVALQFAGDLLADGSAELRAAGIVVGKRTLLVPVALPPEGIARIDGIRVVAGDGREIPARFAGAFRDYMALLIETDADLPVDELPPGFSLLNPLLPPEADGAGASPGGGLVQRWRIDYALGRRRETADHDRWLGTFRGYRGDVVVETRTNEEDGSLAFDADGRLVALSLTPRLMKTGEGPASAPPGFRPAGFVSRRLRASDAFDPSLHPVDEGQGERLIDLGVEFQPLDPNTARLFDAARETRGGDIGLLVTHVYPGTIAAGIGLREHDVLLRLSVAGRGEPVELRSGGYSFGGGDYDVDMSSETFRLLLPFMPPPWPPRENAVSTLLTGLGAGRRVGLEYMREGTLLQAGFATEFFEPDYGSAAKTRFPLLGLTVKPVTYEVARFFNKPKGRGVIVSKVEEGGKGSVAGLHHYLLVTHVDGREVEGVDDFAARVRSFEDGGADAVELTVDSFGKTRLVKIE